MIFIFNGRKYGSETAVEIVRAIERDSSGYVACGAGLRDFLAWSLARLADAIPLRDLEISPHLGDETIAFNYLCLLDIHGIGKLYETQAARSIINENR